MRQIFRITALVLTALLFVSAKAYASVEWNLSLWGKPRIFTEHIEKLSELVEQKTKGTFKINLHYEEKLSKSNEKLDGISIGAFDMAQFCTGDNPEKTPTLNVLELPFLGVKTLEEEIRVSMAIYKHPAVAKDLSHWKAMLLMPTPLPQFNVAGTGNPPKNIIEYRNLDIRATGEIGAAFKEIGSTPKALEPTQIINSLKNGVIKAVAFAEHAHLFYKTLDQAKWWTTNLNPGTVNCPVIVNLVSFNKLSKEHKEALTSSVLPALAHYAREYQQKHLKKFEEKLLEKKITKVTYSKTELENFDKRIAIPTREQWIKSMNAKGIPGDELYQLIVKTLATKPEKPLFAGIKLDNEKEKTKQKTKAKPAKRFKKRIVRRKPKVRKKKPKPKPKFRFFPDDF